MAGVSHMTVSRVLNDHPNIRPETRQRVLQAIGELNYRPNSAARALATQRTRRIGVMIESTRHHGPTGALGGLEAAARKAGYSVTSVALQQGGELSPQEAVDHLTDQGVDAICVVAPRSSSVATLRQLAIDVPVLVIKSQTDSHFLTVAVDQAAGARMVVDHLAHLGHTDVLHLSGPLDWLDARTRERAFHARTTEWKMRQRPVVVGDWSADFAYDYVKGLNRAPDYTAIFAGNDEMALGLLHGFHDRGIRVPDDVSIVGFDDIDLAAHFTPPLTTIRQDLAALGTTAVEVLSAAAEGREIPHRTLQSVDFILRSSTARPRGSAG